MSSSNYFLCLLGAMDSLWFHQVILFSQPTSLIFPQNLESIQPAQPVTDSFSSPSPSLSLSSLDKEELSSEFSPVGDEENLSESPLNSTLQDYSIYEEEEDEEDEQEKEGEEYSNQKQAAKVRSYSSSPLAEKIEDPRYSRRRLQKSMSCRTMGELELEEVKGFMDLGFTFNKEHMSPRMVSLLPGLQRIVLVNKNKQKADELVGVEDEEKNGIMRPYLSEAWLIKKPNSPLLNLRIPKVTAAADMKKLLKFWARTVASEIQ